MGRGKKIVTNAIALCNLTKTIALSNPTNPIAVMKKDDRYFVSALTIALSNPTSTIAIVKKGDRYFVSALTIAQLFLIRLEENLNENSRRCHYP